MGASSGAIYTCAFGREKFDGPKSMNGREGGLGWREGEVRGWEWGRRGEGGRGGVGEGGGRRRRRGEGVGGVCGGRGE